jgi:hypothetical protein
LDFVVAGFAAVLLFFAGGASVFVESLGVSFGESASTVPTLRNSDSVSAASFFIASLFFGLKKSECDLEKFQTPRSRR